MADVTLPQLGETVTEGTITQWFKAVGDTVAADEPLFEVSTDKVDTEVPSPVAGTLSEIRVPEGETVSVGTVIAVVGDGDASDSSDAPPEEAAEEAPKAEDAPKEEEAPKQEEAPNDESPADDSSASGEEPQKEEDSSEGAAPGAPDASADDTKAAEGSASDEADAARGQSEAETASGSDLEAAGAASVRGGASPQADATAAAEGSASDEADKARGQSEAAAEPASNRARLLSPVVRRLVNEHGLDPESISGSGPGGRITRDDVQAVIDGSTSAPPAAAEAAEAPAAAAPAAAAAAPVSAPAPASRGPAPTAGEHDETVKLTKIRKLTGAAMINSKAASPHAFSVVEVDFHNVDLARGEVKQDWKAAEGFSLTYLPFISRAVIDALDEYPHMNASVGDNELIVHGFVDLGIAVDLDYEGLIVPVIRGAEGKRLGAIAKEINDLAGRARTKKLSPDEISGGTFTISNNGSAGSVLTFPIINQPQVAILSTDAIVRKPVVATLPDGTEAVVIHPVGNLAMAWDHRAFDGAYAAGFLKRVKEIIETKSWSEEF